MAAVLAGDVHGCWNSEYLAKDLSEYELTPS